MRNRVAKTNFMFLLLHVQVIRLEGLWKIPPLNTAEFSINPL